MPDNKKALFYFCFIVMAFVNGCYSSNILGPFQKNELRDSVLSIAHFEKDKILFMDFSSCYKNINSFKWKEYKEYINCNKHEVDFIAFSISPDEIFLTSNIFIAMSHVKNWNIKYGILFYSPSREQHVFLKKIPCNKKYYSLKHFNHYTYRITENDEKLLHEIKNTINSKMRDVFFIYISTDLFLHTSLFDFFEGISNNNVNFFFF